MRPGNTVLLAVLAMQSVPLALAQESSTTVHEPPVLEEIIVTATLREVNLQDLPMSVGVVTGSDMDDIGAVSIDDVWRMVPNLAVRDAPLGGRSFIIRGLADTDSFQSTESINAFYLDDTAFTYVPGLFSAPADVAMLDLQRIEVLRGPQGTLVGANAMGGAVRMITHEPDPSSSTRRFEANLSNTENGGWNYGGRFTWNQPTGPNSAVRFAALYQDDDGFIDDIGRQIRDYNDQKRVAGRFSWLWNVSESFEVLARLYAENIDTGGFNYSDPLGKPWAGLSPTDDLQVVLYSDMNRDEDIATASLRLKWQTGIGELMAVTSWFEKELIRNYDWSPELFLNFGVDAPAPFWGDLEQRDISQEIRLTSQGNGRLSWLAGTYFLDQDAERLDIGTIPSLGGEFLNIFERSGRQDLAVFGEAGWQFTDRLEGVIGGRWYRIERDLMGMGVVPQGAFTSDLEGDTSDFVAKASLAFDVNEQTMVYGQVSEGFRPGQFNTIPAVELCGARPLIDSDSLTNYELGLKSRFRDGRVTLNVTAFHIDWDDMQVDTFDPDLDACGFVVLENAGSATSEGVELEFEWLISDRFRLQGGVGYNEAELAEAFRNPNVDAPAGTPIPNVPEWTANVSGTWDFSWSEQLGGYVRGDVQYVDSRSTTFQQSFPPVPVPILTELDDYTLVNLRVGADSRAWTAELFVNNLFDEQAQLGCCRMFWDPAVNRPRTIGLRTIWDFD